MSVWLQKVSSSTAAAILLSFGLWLLHLLTIGPLSARETGALVALCFLSMAILKAIVPAFRRRRQPK